MRAAVLGLLLLGCGPVMLGEQEGRTSDDPRLDDDGGPPEDESTADAGAGDIALSVSVKPVDCGRCFELNASASGGEPPYDFEWDDGSSEQSRRVCSESNGASLTVVARDRASARSTTHSIQLEGFVEEGCPASMPPSPPPPALVCLENLSFEGTPSANFGLPENFDATPWTTCTNDPLAANTPMIINNTIPRPEGIVEIPDPTQGDTYVALSEDHQVSQRVCSPIGDATTISLELDVARLTLMTVASTEALFLEIWSGLAIDCSRNELLWASESLQSGWQRVCVTLRPRSYFDQLTFRARTDQTQLAPSFLLIDNLKPVDRCP